MSTTAVRPLPRAKGHLILGSALDLAAGPHRFVAQAGAAHSGIVGFRLLHRPFAAISDAELIRHVLVTRQDRYRRSFHYENPVVGQGLLTTDGPVWLKRRRQVTPAFRTDTLRAVSAITREETLPIVAEWEAAARAGRHANAVADMQRLTVSVSGRALFSRSLSPEDAARFVEEIREALKLVRRRNTSLFRVPGWFPSPRRRKLLRSRDALDAFLRPIITERRANEGVTNDLLDALVGVRDPETGDGLTDQEVLEEAKTLFAAGFETTATAMSWVLYLLASHPEVAERLHAELDRELGDRDPEWHDLERLRYTSHVISEAMRLYPPVYNVARICVERDEIAGYIVEPGTVVLMSILGVHHDPAYWPDPELFRPERFEGEWPRKAYIPFATGKHLCIGNNFALTEMAVILAMLARRFRISRAEERPVEPAAQITLVPGREIPLRVELR